MGVRHKPQADPMPQTLQAHAHIGDEPNRTQRPARKHAEQRLRPALISIGDAAEHIGVARSTFYKDFLPVIESVRLGKRRLVVMESLDQLIEKLRR
jgi:hypothetical protein